MLDSIEDIIALAIFPHAWRERPEDAGVFFDLNRARDQSDGVLKVRAALAALDAAGFVVVPKEPTKEMILAGDTELDNFEDESSSSDIDGNRYDYTHRREGWERGVYQAMLAARPKP
jgi:hypothetical protein